MTETCDFSDRQNKILSELKKISTTRALGHDYAIELAALWGDQAVHAAIQAWEVPPFPVTGAMLIERGYAGVELGKVLKDLHRAWQQTGYIRSAEELLNTAETVLRDDYS